jgi:hypothetical protein
MIFKPSDIDRLNLYISSQFSKGKTLKVEPVTESKTLPQLRYIWLVFTHLAFETGSDKEYMYFLFLKRFPVYHEGKNLNGEIELVPVSMSKFTKDELSAFIDKVVTELRAQGFEVIDPEDKRAVELYNFYHSKGLI